MDALGVWADRPNELNTSLYRIKIPFRYLNMVGHNVGTCFFGELPSSIPDTVLVERIITPDFINRLRAGGAKRIIATFDDCYKLIPESTPSSKYWREHHDDFVAALGMVDLAIVPSMALADFYRSKCKDIRLVENFIDGDLWQCDPLRIPGTENKIVIGWGGTWSHNASWPGSGAGPALARIKEKYGDRVEIVIVSNSSHEALSKMGVEHLPLKVVPFQDWPAYVKGFDIGIAPLGSAYDRYRSCLKLVEYGLASTPWVADNLDPYFGCLLGGTRVGKQSEWVSELSRLIDSAEIRRSTGASGRYWAKTYLMSRNIGLYEEVLRLK